MIDQTGQAPTFEPGSKFDGYTIEKQIGEGAMAVLFLAHDDNGHQRVLKVPRRTFDTDPVAVVAFENELRLAHYLEDFPHAYMPVAEGGSDRSINQSGRELHYLVMDYIDGSDLWIHLREQGCLSEAQAIALTKKIVYALAELHRRRIVHLDIKLSNIMITRDGEVRLVDFGLANHMDLHDHIYESFQEPKGSPAYIAPEQFFGVRDEPRSDLFSIGTMLFEMTTAKLPFLDANSARDVVSRIKSGALSPRHYRPELSEDFATLVLTCLQNMPDRRFADMDALYLALEQLESQAADAGVAAGTASETTPSISGGKLLASITGKFKSFVQSFEGDKISELQTWIVAHKASRQPRYRIVAAFDSSSDERATELNRDILYHAIRQARLQPSIITVLSVLSDHNAALGSVELERNQLNAVYLAAREAMKRIIDITPRGDLPISLHIRSGEPVTAIAGCVADYGADLLVIGACKRNALSRFVLGSTAYKILTTIKCPVIVVQENADKR